MTMIKLCKPTKAQLFPKLQIILHNSIADFKKSDWNKIAADNLFMQYDYLRCLENYGPDNVSYKYVIVTDESNSSACFYFQLIDFKGDSFGTSKKNQLTENNIQSKLKLLLKRKAEKINLRLLISGNVFISGEHGVSYTSGFDQSKIFYSLQLVIDKIVREDKSSDKISAILIKDFLNPENYDESVLVNDRYHRFTGEPDMIIRMRPNWRVFSDYIDSLNSKYKKRAISIFNKAKTLKCVEFTHSDILLNADEINMLYLAVFEKARFRPAALNADYFSAMKKMFPDKFSFSVYFDEDKIVGFRSSFLNGKTLEAHFIGMNYNYIRKYELYQNILYDYLRDAFKYSADVLNLGRTASEMKSNIGAEPINLICFGRHKHSLQNHLIKPFIKQFQPDEWIQRNPFK